MSPRTTLFIFVTLVAVILIIALRLSQFQFGWYYPVTLVTFILAIALYVLLSRIAKRLRQSS